MVEKATEVTTLSSVQDLEERKKNEGLTWNQLDPNHLKYEDRYGRTRIRTRTIVHRYVCPFDQCRATTCQVLDTCGGRGQLGEAESSAHRTNV